MSGDAHPEEEEEEEPGPMDLPMAIEAAAQEISYVQMTINRSARCTKVLHLNHSKSHVEQGFPATDYKILF